MKRANLYPPSPRSSGRPQQEHTALFGAVLILALVSAASFGASSFLNLHLPLLDAVRENPGDAVLVGLTFILAAIVADLLMGDRRKRRDAELQQQRIKALKSTVDAIQDFMDDFLINLGLFRTELSISLSEDSLEVFDDMIAEASAKLAVSAFPETKNPSPVKTIAAGIRGQRQSPVGRAS